jgi:hypothetical protein
VLCAAFWEDEFDDDLPVRRRVAGQFKSMWVHRFGPEDFLRDQRRV